MKLLWLAALVCGAGVNSAHADVVWSQEGRYCVPQIEPLLEPAFQRTVDLSHIVESRSQVDHRLFGYSYWFRVEGCEQGFLIVDTNEFCEIKQTYTRGSCQLSGIPHWQ